MIRTENISFSSAYSAADVEAARDMRSLWEGTIRLLDRIMVGYDNNSGTFANSSCRFIILLDTDTRKHHLPLSITFNVNNINDLTFLKDERSQDRLGRPSYIVYYS